MLKFKFGLSGVVSQETKVQAEAFHGFIVEVAGNASCVLYLGSGGVQETFLLHDEGLDLRPRRRFVDFVGTYLMTRWAARNDTQHVRYAKVHFRAVVTCRFAEENHHGIFAPSGAASFYCVLACRDCSTTAVDNVIRTLCSAMSCRNFVFTNIRHFSH